MGSIQTPAPGAAGAQKEASATLNTDIQMLVSQRFIDSYPRFYRLAYRYLGREADAQDACLLYTSQPGPEPAKGRPADHGPVWRPVPQHL